MKFFPILNVWIISVLFSSCLGAQNDEMKYVLDAKEFSAKISSDSNYKLIDCRSPEEYGKGHLYNSQNIDWNGDDFEEESNKLDKTKAVYIYCFSGGRSHTAANKLRKIGFTVYEMDGGILNWRAAGLSEERPAINPKKGMSFDDFNTLITDEKMVLVDFYAPWCGPCRKMKPFLEDLEKEKAGTLKVVRINIDEHPQLARQMKIDVIPVLQIYKDQEMLWTNMGYLDKKGVVKAIERNDK